jgi:hypothetical protein
MVQRLQPVLRVDRELHPLVRKRQDGVLQNRPLLLVQAVAVAAWAAERP